MVMVKENYLNACYKCKGKKEKDSKLYSEH